MNKTTYIFSVAFCLFSLVSTYSIHGEQSYNDYLDIYNEKLKKYQDYANWEKKQKILDTRYKFLDLVTLQGISSRYYKSELINAKQLISDYEFVVQEYNKQGLSDRALKFNETIKYYRSSKPIHQVDSKIAQAFEIIKKDLQIDQSVELRVLPDDIYERNKVAGFFEAVNPGVVYIIDRYLQEHPVLIIRSIVHELEHHRQFWCYPDSFAWTLQNKELLGQDEFGWQLEHGADKRVAEYFKCCPSLTYLAIFGTYSFGKNSKGYFSFIDYMPYIYQSLFLSSRAFGLSWLINEPVDILDYLPSSGTYKVDKGKALILTITLAVLVNKAMSKKLKLYVLYMGYSLWDITGSTFDKK